MLVIFIYLLNQQRGSSFVRGGIGGVGEEEASLKSAPERASKSQSEIELPLRRPSLPHPLPSRFSLAFAACSVVFCLGRKVPFSGLSSFRSPFQARKEDVLDTP